MPHNGRRNADQVVLAALACGATVEAAARQAGVSAATVHRRLKDPKFSSRLQTLGGDMVQRMARTMTAAGSEAVRTLLELMKPASPHAARLGAARSVLEIGVKLREAAELEERLTILEGRIAAEAARR
jgi:hypothetical protein